MSLTVLNQSLCHPSPFQLGIMLLFKGHVTCRNFILTGPH